MFSPKTFALAGVFAFSLTSPLLAADPYVTSKLLDVTVLIPPPPVVGSPEDQADVQAVLDAQAHASDARKAQSLTDSDESFATMFAGVLGNKFDAAKLPKTMAFFERVSKSEGRTIDPAKELFKRVRPYLAHPEIKAYAKPSKAFSYPSGHTTKVTLMAIVLSEMVPEKQREIWARAADYAQSRVVGGMHYPTDIAVSWRTGTAIAAVMAGLPEFQADRAAAIVELRAALGLSTLAAK